MKISIIGSNGLLSNSIGKYCNANKINLDVYGLQEPVHHSYDNFYPVDLLKEDLQYNQLSQSDVIIYAVGGGIQSNLNEPVDLIYSLNVDIPIKIYNHLKLIGYRGVAITFGSYFEIGEMSENKCYTESDVLYSDNKAPNDYAISKRLLSRFISSFEAPFKFWHFILPTIYGENESSHRLIPYTIQALRNNTEIQFTSGEQVRQYIYIDEIIQIIESAVENKMTSGIYNISGTETLTVKELVSILFNVFNKSLTESVFGKVQRTDIGMKILKLNGNKLYESINYKPTIKIIDVYDRY
ncbi:MAG: NAD(P)-dependent oxidoreductase [Candidatus Symbiothrix sp.]|jgi:nucleoside-diphosphate-sugar epimerase|nr:NAD(P)-dependent oxidoreductase [Candidatus Symbiothrix sp.]